MESECSGSMSTSAMSKDMVPDRQALLVPKTDPVRRALWKAELFKSDGTNLRRVADAGLPNRKNLLGDGLRNGIMSVRRLKGFQRGLVGVRDPSNVFLVKRLSLQQTINSHGLPPRSAAQHCNGKQRRIKNDSRAMPATENRQIVARTRVYLISTAHRLIEALREQRYAYELRHRWVCTEARLVQSDYMRAKAVTRVRSCENTRNRTYERRHNRRRQ